MQPQSQEGLYIVDCCCHIHEGAIWHQPIDSSLVCKTAVKCGQRAGVNDVWHWMLLQSHISLSVRPHFFRCVRIVIVSCLETVQ